MKSTDVRCPHKRHLLARVLSVSQESWKVTPERIVLYGEDERHRSRLTTQGAAAGSWLMTDSLPFDVDALACACGEFRYPEDFVDQVKQRRRVVLAIPF